MTLSRVAVLALALSALSVVASTAQSPLSDSLSPLPPGATWDTLYRVFHAHHFVVHRLATRWSTVSALAQLIAADSAFGVFVIKHVDATTDEAELRRVLSRSSTSCPPHARALCVAIHTAAGNAVAQTAQPN